MASLNLDETSEVEPRVRARLIALQNQKHNHLCDTILDVGTGKYRKSFYVIGSLFALHSQVFEKQLFGSMIESHFTSEQNIDSEGLDSDTSDGIKRKYVRIEDVSYQTCQFLISLFYGLKPAITHINCANILYAAKKYLLTTLEKETFAFIVDRINTSMDLLLPILGELEKYGLNDDIAEIIRRCDIFSSQNAVEAIRSTQFHSLPKCIAVSLVSNDELILNISEEVIFERCIKWCKYHSLIRWQHASENEQTSLDSSDSVPSESSDEKSETQSNVSMEADTHWVSLFDDLFKPFIRFPIMRPNYFTRIVRNSGALTDSELLSIALYKLDSNCKTRFNCFERKKRNKPINKVCFDAYRTDIVTVSLPKKKSVTLQTDEYTTFGYSRGFSHGVHKWTIQICNTITDATAIGVMTNVDICTDHSIGLWDNEVECAYWLYYDGNIYHTDKCAHSQSLQCGWTLLKGDRIEISLDCVKWTIQFSQNDCRRVSMPIAPNKTYHPAVSACVAGECFRVL